jgi:hypothetical protein
MNIEEEKIDSGNLNAKIFFTSNPPPPDPCGFTYVFPTPPPPIGVSRRALGARAPLAD